MPQWNVCSFRNVNTEFVKCGGVTILLEYYFASTQRSILLNALRALQPTAELFV